MIAQRNPSKPATTATNPLTINQQPTNQPTNQQTSLGSSFVGEVGWLVD